jgi:hypothetical protein
VQVAADRAHHHRAAIQSHSDLNAHAFGGLHLGGMLLHRGLHGKRRVAGPHRVVLMRDRRAEERHDAVAHDLIDGPLVAVHRGHHALEDGVEELTGFLGVAVGQQLHRALEIGEQHGDLLALAFKGGFGCQDFLGEMGWCVCLG